MRKNSMVFIMIICLSAIVSLDACTPGSADNGDFDENLFSVVKVNAMDLISPYAEQSPAAGAAAGGANDFAFRLSALLAQDAGGKNFVCSPFSVWLPLAALVNATDALYKPALITALGAGGLSETDINRAASRMLYNLTDFDSRGNKDYHNPLKIANAIFVGKNVTLRNEFAQTYMDYFRGSSINVDFSSGDAVDAVNRWASRNTDGLIKEVVNEFDQHTVAAIANAIYFSDKWRREFNEKDTREDVFHAPGGDSTAFYMLHQDGLLPYYEDDAVQAAALGFTHNAGMYIILPKEGSATDFLASMTNEYFKQMQQGRSPIYRLK